MNKKQKKMAVLAVLRQSTEAIQLSALLNQLDSSFAKRTVRRWLHEWAQDGVIEKTGQKRGTLYCAIPEKKITQSNSEAEFVFSKHTYAALQGISKPLFQRSPVTYNQAWFDAYQPNHTFYLSAEQREKLTSVGNPKAAEVPAGTVAHKIYDRLLVELSYNSSRLEGNTYSFGDTEKLIMEGIDSSGKLDAEKIMILNHKEAIRYLVDNAHRLEISFNTICTLHYLLSDNLILQKYSGKVRDHSVKIGSSTYIPLDNPTHLSAQLKNICDVATKINDPHEQSFFLLVHVAYLQFFVDVNKRTARLSANIPLIKNNLYPLAFNKISKDDYISAMIVIYEQNDPRVLAELYTFSCLYTAREYNVLIHSIGLNETRVRFRKEIRQIIRNIILNKIEKQTLEKYILEAVENNIPVPFQAGCVSAIHEDLLNIGPERVHSLGVTQEELKKWLAR